METERSYKEKIKDQGFLQEKQKETFVLRVVTPDGSVTAKQYQVIAQAAEIYGNGQIQHLPRMTIELRGIQEKNLLLCRDFLLDAGLETGGTGSRIRPIVCCKGSTCKNGQYDTYQLSRKIHERFYKKYYDRILPHKFEIAIAGCPNNCVRSYFNDVGIAALKRGFKIYIGGNWSRYKRMGSDLGVYLKTEEEVFQMVEKILLFYEKHAKPRERFSRTLNRLGEDVVRKALLEEDKE